MSVIVIHTGGTLGDHFPFFALARGLSERGHHVRLAINQAMHPFARRIGIEAIALGDVERGPEEARENAWSWDHWSHDPVNHPKAKPFDMERYLRQVRELIALCRDADLLIDCSIRDIGFVVQRALDIPRLTVSVMPFNFWQPTDRSNRADLLNRDAREYEETRDLFATVFQQLGIRREIPPFSRGFLWSDTVLLASSPHFSRPDLRGFLPGHRVQQTGFLYFEDPAWAAWQPDETLRAFFDRPPERRPIVFGYSSIPIEHPERILAPHVEAAAALGRPLMVLGGWAGFSEAHLPPGANRDEILFADFLPQDWIFAHAACAIQHGGIGTLARALKQGCPLLIEPLGNDQLYNATRIHDLGVGDAVHPFLMTAEMLVSILRERVLSDDCRSKAALLGERLRAERGLEATCRRIDDFLKRPRERKRICCPHPIREEIETTAPATVGDIPKILHQTWTTSCLPPELAAWRETWIKHHPDWRFCLWTDVENRAFLERHYPWFLPIYDHYPNAINRADTIRYFLLHHFGGVYADLDMECLRPLDPLLDGKKIVLGLEPETHVARHSNPDRPLSRIVCNAWMASAPGHPFWEHLFKHLIASHRREDPLDATAVFMLTRAVETFRDDGEVHLLPADLIHPLHNAQSWRDLAPAEQKRIAETAFTLHHWVGTWWRARPRPNPRIPVTLLFQGATLLWTEMDPDIFPEVAYSHLPPPRVSCLLVTGGEKAAERASMAMRSVLGFRQQTYPAKELLIVDDGTDGRLESWVRGLSDERIRHLHLPPEGKSLGALRNIAVEQAAGVFVTQWDDDDLSDPRRLEIQMALILLLRADACMLQRHTIWWPHERRMAVTRHKIWESSFVCRRDRMPAYPDLRRGEDTPLIERIASEGQVVLADAPDLYTYIFHGKNTWGAEHFNMWWDTAMERYAGEEYEALQGPFRQRMRLDEIEAGLPTGGTDS